MDGLITITDLTSYEVAIQEHSIVVFSTTWCPDCHFLKTFIKEIVDENPDWKFFYVDRDQMIDLCVDLEILGIPSFIAYDKGEELSRFVSKLRKTKPEIQAFIDAIRNGE